MAAIASKFTVPILIWGPRDERPNTDELGEEIHSAVCLQLQRFYSAMV